MGAQGETAEPAAYEETYELVLPGVRPQQAFEAWVEGIASWWDRAPGEPGSLGGMIIEPRFGGGVGLRVGGYTYPWGEVTRWEPGRALAHTTAAHDGHPSEQVTVDFFPEGDGTLVRLGGGAVAELDTQGRSGHAWATVLARYAAYTLRDVPDPDGPSTLRRAVAGIRRLGPSDARSPLGALGQYGSLVPFSDLGPYGLLVPLALKEVLAALLRRGGLLGETDTPEPTEVTATPKAPEASDVPEDPGAPETPDAEQLDVLVVYCPVEQTQRVLTALFGAGAGVIGDYQECAFVSRGTGQFRPVRQARPSVGQLGEREQVDENRIELTVRRRLVPVVVAALRQAHPYEEPAFHVLRTSPVDDAPATG